MENKDKLVTAEGLKAVYDALKDGIPADITVSTTGDGNAITSIEKSGSTITATKGSSFAASWHQHNPGDLTNGLLNSNIYITAHPEDGQGSIYPFLNNDIAFLSTRGGSISAYTTTATDYTATTLAKATDYTTLSSVDLITDASPTYCVFRLSSQSDVLVVDLTLPASMNFEYNSKFYIDFGGWQWGALSVSLYLWNNSSTNAEQAYRLIKTGTGQYRAWYTQGEYTWYTDAGKTTVGGYSFNRMRFVLTNWATTQGYRIAQIGVLNYNSTAQRATTMSRGIDDEIYRSITPVSNDTYNLGSASKAWSHVYTNVMRARQILLTASNGTPYSITIDTNGKLLIGGEAIATDYTLPIASSTALGGVKIGSGLSISSDGTLSTELPSASSTTAGAIILGTGLGIDTSNKAYVRFGVKTWDIAASDWQTTTSASSFTTVSFNAVLPIDTTIFVTYDLSSDPTSSASYTQCAAQYAALAQAQLYAELQGSTTSTGTGIAGLQIYAIGSKPTVTVRIRATYTY